VDKNGDGGSGLSHLPLSLYHHRYLFPSNGTTEGSGHLRKHSKYKGDFLKKSQGNQSLKCLTSISKEMKEMIWTPFLEMTSPRKE
jgi:hypothetical protein